MAKPEDIYFSIFTTDRYPHPRGRRIKISRALSNIGSYAIKSQINTGGYGTSIATGGSWSNINLASLGTNGLLQNQTGVDNSLILTSHAPLTKGEGDGALADTEDVTVTIDGSDVDPLYVDAPAGIILMDRIISKDSDVTIDYHYTPDLNLEIELNKTNFKLNQYDNDTQYVFEYESVLGPYKRPQPKKYEYRWQAFDANYTSVLNDPTTLKLNEPRHSITLPKFDRTYEPKSIFYDGSAHPIEFDHTGPSLGSPLFEEGLYLIDDQVESKNTISGRANFFHKKVSQDYRRNVIINTRFKVFSNDTDDDFTGVAFGYSDENKLCQIGLLEVGSSKFIGILSDSGDESFWESYRGISVDAEERSSKVDKLVFNFDPPFQQDNKVFINGDSYKVSDIDEADNKWHVFIDGDLNKTGTYQVFPELDWEELTTYRLFKDEQGNIEVFAKGSITPYISTKEKDLASTEEIFEEIDDNEVFFGSLSRKSKSKTGWDFVRYSIQPSKSSQQEGSISVDTEFNDLPENDSVNPWHSISKQGYDTIFSNEFLLTQSAGQPKVNGGVVYERNEPFLSDRSKINLKTSLRVHSWSEGSPAFLSVVDDRKKLVVALFEDGTSFQDQDLSSEAGQGTLDSRDIPEGYNTGPSGLVGAYSGVQIFSDVGWDSNFDSSDLSFYDDYLRVDHDGSSNKETEIPQTSGDSGAVVSAGTLGARVRLNEYTTTSSNQVPLYFGLRTGESPTESHVFLGFKDDGSTKQIVFCDENGNILTSSGNPIGVDYDWGDGFHHYRVVKNGTNLTLYVDGEYQDLFDITNLPTQSSSATIGGTLKLGLLSKSINFDLDSFFAHNSSHNTRKIGVYKGGGSLLNPSNYDLKDLEWYGQFVDVQVIRDPAGTTDIYLDKGASQTPDLSYQYSDLPDRDSVYETGYIRFGTKDPQAYSETLWDFIRYDITTYRDEIKADNNSYLNRYHTVTSGEDLDDESPEILEFQSETSTTIDLSSEGVAAERVLSVVKGNKTFAFDYNKEENLVTLTSDSLSSEHETVEITFYHSEPYSKEYLENNRPHTVLNEETPPYELSQQVNLTSEESFSSQLNNPDDTLNDDPDFVLNDSRLVIQYDRGDDPLYESLDLYENTSEGEDGLIEPAKDDLTGIELDHYKESYNTPDQEDTSDQHHFRMGYFNRGSEFNDPETISAFVPSPQRFGIDYNDSEDYDAGSNVTDTAPTNQPNAYLEDFNGSSFFNNKKTTFNVKVTDTNDVHEDSTPAVANNTTSTIIDIDYSSTIYNS